ncbi:hypothetical protein OAQ96_01800 [Alphaproteobacteria bacterium]|nr:hypothetical protein [Alphaproteobacteria bacterium]
MKNFLFNKYTAYNYLKSQKQVNDLLSYHKKYIDNKEYELIAKKIVKSYVSYHFPWRSLSSKYNILFHAKGVFNEEIIGAFSNSKEFKVYQYQRSLNKVLAKYFFPEDITHFNYKESQLSDEIKKCFNFYNKILKYIKNKRKIDIIYSGNYGAFDESVLARSAIHNDIKFVSFHKECVMSDGAQDFYYQVSKNGREKFNGTRILVYNKTTKKLLEKLNICEHNKIEICPMVRLDKCYDSRKKFVNNFRKFNRLAYFYIQPNNQLPSLYYNNFSFDKKILESEPSSWKNLNQNTNKVIYDIAIHNPNLEVVVKCKFQDFYDCKKNFLELGVIPNNLKITYGQTAFSLISISDVICSFNSTAIIEAVVSGKKVISPYFDEASNIKFKKYLIDFGNLITKAHTTSDLKDLLLHNMTNTTIPNINMNNDELDIVNYWTSNTDGLANHKLRLKTKDIISHEKN